MTRPIKKAALLALLIAFSASTMLFTSCGGDDPDKPIIGGPDTTAPVKLITCTVETPDNQANIVIGTQMPIVVKSSYPERTIVQVKYFVDKDLVGTTDTAHTFLWDTNGVLGGQHVIRAEAEYDDGTIGTQRRVIKIVSDTTPSQQSYRIVNTFPHDPTSYTQGLVYADGILYEGTGLNKESKLAKVDIKTGKALQKIDLDDAYFGEGIAVMNNKIYQLTWVRQTCFVYDKGNLGELRRFQFASEGWGLTHNGEHLIMSDGTSKLKFLDPETFEEKRRIVAITDLGEVDSLNELEWINGEIWANVYQTDVIIRIDPENGKVLGVINMEGLLTPQQRALESVDVLNGIAYDSINNRIFVTGKKWPSLFEVVVQ